MKTNLSPPRVLALGFLGLILAGSVLLLLPMSTKNGCSVTDAVFTATSAVCVTGLVVKDTPVDFTLFGQLVIMALIQLGGLGYMTSASIIPLVMGKKIGLGQRVLIKEALNTLSVEGVVRFTKAVLKVTLFIELCGALMLSSIFIPDMGILKGVYFGVFHSISAFNNAGFSLFSSSLTGYAGSIPVNFVVCSLIILGGIGFFVMSDFFAYLHKDVRRLTQHTKLVALSSLILIILGAAGFYVFERSNPATLAGMEGGRQALVSLFSSITARTAGFNTVDFSALGTGTLLMIMLLMFIGAAPGSTGGGVKVTTFSTIILSLISTIRGKQDVVIFNRRITEHLVFKAFTIVALSSFFIAASSLTLMYLEKEASASYIFEVVSAFGTVGLSEGDGGSRSLSAILGSPGKLVVAVTMFFGRLGPLTLAFAMLRGEKERVRFPEGKVIIG